MFKDILRTWFITVLSALVLVGCGGGGGSPPPVSTELNRYAYLSYVQKVGTTCIPYEGFELRPVINGNIGSGVPSYKLLGSLPTGLSFNTITGVVTGVPANINAAEASLPFVTVQLTVSGYTGTQGATLGAPSSDPTQKFGAFTAFGFLEGGLSFTTTTTAIAATGSVGDSGTINFRVTLDQQACGGSTFDDLPDANFVGYGLVSTPPGSSINTATGSITFTPQATGTYVFQQYVDLLIDGKPARHQMNDFPVFVN